MRKIIFNIFLLIICLKNFQQNYVGQFDLIKSKNVPFKNFSLVPKFTIFKKSKTICLKECLKNDFCEFIVYHNGYCSLHTEYALKRLQNSNLSIIYQKKSINE